VKPFSGVALAWLVAALVGLAVFAVGAATDLSLGDENYHFRKASLFAEYGSRLAYDPLYGPDIPPGIPYFDGPAWHTGLAILWRLTGQTVLAAQAYQAAWLVLLIGCAFMAGSALGGPQAGWWSLLAAATMPASLFFSVVLYNEVAMLALMMLGLCLALRRWYVISGIALGLAFMVKPTACIVFPAFLLAIILLTDVPWRKRALAALLFCLGTALVVGPDLWWRHEHLGTVGMVYMSRSGGSDAVPEVIRQMLREKGPETFYWTSSVLNPADIVMHLGVVVTAGLVLALAWLRRATAGRLALTLALALFLAAEVFQTVRDGTLDVRYAMGAFFLPVLLAGPVLAQWVAKRRWLAWVLIAVAILQAGAVMAKAASMRRLPAGQIQAIRRIADLPIHRQPGYVICPDSTISTYGNRPILWAAINPGPFFFTWPPDKQWLLLDYFGVEYIVIPRARIYDDSQAKHTGGYPKSWVEALPHMPYADPTPVVDTPTLLVYRVKPKT
jgi:4-amino-4-deoxy-L-arabinose transferase-like glycosyltransferase